MSHAARPTAREAYTAPAWVTRADAGIQAQAAGYAAPGVSVAALVGAAPGEPLPAWIARQTRPAVGPVNWARVGALIEREE